MTLDEAIVHAEEVAEKHESDFGLCPYPSDMCNGTHDCRSLKNGKEKGCLKCANEHRQLAGWLKQLKELRQYKGDLISRERTIDSIRKEIDAIHNPEYMGGKMDCDASSYEKGLFHGAVIVKQQKAINTKSEWILCSDRMPEEDDYRECYHAMGGAVWWCDKFGRIGLGWYDYSTKQWSTLNDYKVYDVIAWRELPESLKGYICGW